MQKNKMELNEFPISTNIFKTALPIDVREREGLNLFTPQFREELEKSVEHKKIMETESQFS